MAPSKKKNQSKASQTKTSQTKTFKTSSKKPGKAPLKKVAAASKAKVMAVKKPAKAQAIKPKSDLKLKSESKPNKAAMSKATSQKSTPAKPVHATQSNSSAKVSTSSKVESSVAVVPAVAEAVKGPLLRKPAKLPKNEVLKTKSVRAGRASMPICRETACDSSPVGAGYCRLHYIKNWKKVKNREVILKEGTLNRFIEELVLKYPEKTIDALMSDLSSEVEFAKAVIELALEDPGAGSSDDYDSDDEIAEPIIDNIKKETFDEFEQF